MVSDGDRVTDRPLAEVGGKGLLTKVVDEAVLGGHCDIAVHSLKDVPAELPKGLQLIATPPREDVRDVLITRHDVATLTELPPHSVLGTSSPRRAAQVRALLPGVRVELLRGNVPTRIERVMDPAGSFDATLLAAAGLNRLGLSERHGCAVPADAVLPAVAQGALGIVARASDAWTLRCCLRLNHAPTNMAVTAERELVHRLEADCHSPIAVLVEPTPPPAGVATQRSSNRYWTRLRARVCRPDGTHTLAFDGRCKAAQLRRLVKDAVADLERQGARDVLREASAASLT